MKIFFFFLFLILHPSSHILAQHTRLYACALANDDPAAFMGGSSLGAGLWQSDDAGKNWKHLGWKHVKCYSVDVTNNGKIIYEACGNGVLKSTDAGSTWKMMTDWRISEVLDIAIDQKKTNTIYIATPGAIWKSDDGGNNWYEADTDIPYPIFVSRIKIDPSDHSKIYAATENGLYISKDGGVEWVNSGTKSSALHDFIINDMGGFAGIDSIGILVWRDTNTNIMAINGSNRNPAYFQSPLYPGEKGTFKIVHGKAIDLPETPKNIHSMISVGSFLFIGSLDGGIWKYNSHYELPVRSGLETEQ